MVFNNFIMRVRRTLLCCNKHKQLDISEPTNVRKVDISDALPGLTDAQRSYIRAKASSDAMHLLSLQPSSSPPPQYPHDASQQPSSPLLNAASRDLPSILPTPPRHMHHDSSPPTTRMKSMKYSPSHTHMSTPRRLSFSTADSSVTESSALISPMKDTHVQGLHESFMTLNLEFDWEDGRRAHVCEGEAEAEGKTDAGTERLSLSNGSTVVSDGEEEFGEAGRTLLAKI